MVDCSSRLSTTSSPGEARGIKLKYDGLNWPLQINHIWEGPSPWLQGIDINSVISLFARLHSPLPNCLSLTLTRIPRHNLRRSSILLRPFLKDLGLDYHSPTFIGVRDYCRRLWGGPGPRHFSDLCEVQAVHRYMASTRVPMYGTNNAH